MYVSGIAYDICRFSSGSPRDLNAGRKIALSFTPAPVTVSELLSLHFNFSVQ